MPGWVAVESPDMLNQRNAAPMTGLERMRAGVINLAGRLGDATLPRLGEAPLGLGESLPCQRGRFRAWLKWKSHAKAHRLGSFAPNISDR
jgi:hypothetical protein